MASVTQESMGTTGVIISGRRSSVMKMMV